MAIARKDEARLKLILSRQWEDRWGKDYVAAIFATPKEAPSISTPTILRPQKLALRDFHTLSQPETWAALLALYHPKVWEIHEQRILSPRPRAHFLYGHERARGMNFPSFAGTLEVADRMGILNVHPKIRLKEGENPKEWPLVPFPYIGDLLLFLEDEKGPFALNWTIKDKYKNFRRRGPNSQGKPLKDVDDDKAIQRQLLEKSYYGDADIRTQQIAGEAIDFDLRCNLADLFGAHALHLTIDDEVRAGVNGLFRSAIGTGVRANAIAQEGAAKYGLTTIDVLKLMRQGIWRREIRVNLFRPILADKPLHPEVEDALVRYKDWFVR